MVHETDRAHFSPKISIFVWKQFLPRFWRLPPPVWGWKVFSVISWRNSLVPCKVITKLFPTKVNNIADLPQVHLQIHFLKILLPKPIFNWRSTIIFAFLYSTTSTLSFTGKTRSRYLFFLFCFESELFDASIYFYSFKYFLIVSTIFVTSSIDCEVCFVVDHFSLILMCKVLFCIILMIDD